jgi:hypothetical protein
MSSSAKKTPITPSPLPTVTPGTPRFWESKGSTPSLQSDRKRKSINEIDSIDHQKITPQEFPQKQISSIDNVNFGPVTPFQGKDATRTPYSVSSHSLKTPFSHQLQQNKYSVTGSSMKRRTPSTISGHPSTSTSSSSRTNVM